MEVCHLFISVLHELHRYHDLEQCLIQRQKVAHPQCQAAMHKLIEKISNIFETNWLPPWENHENLMPHQNLTTSVDDFISISTYGIPPVGRHGQLHPLLQKSQGPKFWFRGLECSRSLGIGLWPALNGKLCFFRAKELIHVHLVLSIL